MSETKHSPSPWSYKPSKSLVRDANGEPAAAGHGGYHCEANSRLIAAAPDLLDVCRLSRSAISAVVANTGEYAPLLTLLDAAIAKAEGGANHV